jgi:hypothetical protein
VERAICETMPGAGWFFEQLAVLEAQASVRPDAHELAPLAFMFAHLEAWRGLPASRVAAEVHAALDSTSAARRRITHATPVGLGLTGADAVDDAQRVAVEALVTDVMPVFRGLIAADVDRLHRWMESSASHRARVQETLGGGGVRLYRTVLGGVAAGRALMPLGGPSALAMRAYAQALEGRLVQRDVVRSGGTSPGQGGLGTPTPGKRRGPPRQSASRSRRRGSVLGDEVDEGPGATWPELQARTGGQVEALVRELEATLPPTVRRAVGRPSLDGLCVDRRMLVRWISQREDPAVFRSEVCAEVGEVAVGILVDRSGSMRQGTKSEVAAEATALVVQVAARMGHAVGVWGFRCEVEDVVAPTRQLTMTDRARIAALSVGARGGNDDGPCLREAWGRLRRVQASRYLLFVISDASPSEGHDAEGALRAAIRDVTFDRRLTLIGIGVGTGTEVVSALYPNGVGDVPVEGLARAVGGMLRAGLRFEGRAKR